MSTIPGLSTFHSYLQCTKLDSGKVRNKARVAYNTWVSTQSVLFLLMQNYTRSKPTVCVAWNFTAGTAMLHNISGSATIYTVKNIWVTSTILWSSQLHACCVCDMLQTSRDAFNLIESL